MLKQLQIRNIAIVETVSVSFDKGFTVITGESGSGKSILLDAIALAFGAKASPREILRSGAQRGQVELLFDITALQDSQPLRDFLEVQGVSLLPDETEILLSREFTPGGSRSRINGTPVTRDVLEALRPWVIDLHGQHELTSLFQRDKQRAYLDAFGDASHRALKRQVAQAYDEWALLKRQLDTLMKNRQDIERQRDFLMFQLQELQEARLEDDQEDVKTRQELEILSHAERLIRISEQGANLLTEGDAQTPAVLDQLSFLQKKLSEGAVYDPALQTLSTQLDGAYAELQAVASELSRYAERVEVHPDTIGQLSERLDTLEKLKRKYGHTLVEVIRRRDALAEELDFLESGEQNFQALEAAIAHKQTALQQVSQQLSDARRQLAEALKQRLLEQLQVLAMPGVSFDIDFLPISYSREGLEEVEFLFSANPGEPLRSLAKVASGGELSRFLLAMKVLTAGADGLLTLVFDEIDSGISGPTAKTVAEKLAALSKAIQVIAITHQPMIAAMGRQHFHVEKKVLQQKDGSETVQVLVHGLAGDDAQRVQVLSRLVSGVDSGDDAVEKFIRRLQADADQFYRQMEGSTALDSVCGVP